MGTTENLIEDCIVYAKSKGLNIVRGPIFNWVEHKNSFDSSLAKAPLECNILGAILFKLGKQDEFKSLDFSKDYIKYICEYVQNDSFYIWKLTNGFNNGNHMTITTVNKDKTEITTKDKVSKFGSMLAAKYVIGTTKT